MKAKNLKEIISGLDDDTEVSVFVTTRMTGERDASIVSVETKTMHMETLADQTLFHEQHAFINCIENIGGCDPVSGNPVQEKND